MTILDARLLRVAILIACAGLLAVPAVLAQQTAKKLVGYNVIVVEKFEVEKNAATENFPKGLDVFMQGRTVVKLREQKIFDKVVDGTEPPVGTIAAESQTSGKEAATVSDAEKKSEESNASKAASPAASERRLLLNSTVVLFDKGSRSARYWGGFGAGQSKVKVRFTLKDAQTNAEVLNFDGQGTFKGVFSTFGGSQEEAFTKAASGVVKALLNELAKNR